MDDRTNRLLLQMIERILAEPGSVEDIDALFEYLSLLGFSTAEVGHAMGWVLSARPDSEQGAVPGRESRTSNSIRVLDEAESQFLTTGAQGYLIQLRELGLVDDVMVDRIIQAALAKVDEVVDQEDIAEIAASVILASAGKCALASFRALPGNEGVDRVH